ncbi:alginate export family protein [Thiohalophilus thiocyanatoxydans]|uniref:Alginate export protein n=1 Tax=Thiohalophilus thiocyanatoxydans TaxID=381308 RepID=A0A4R8IRJ5_9GAMM|nr:alginate export family protein [Thiohalophilus thiocyanatoxydans]TDY03651.1 alginate export protein [Thiohalophilus thiocyanatoxydans]
MKKISLTILAAMASYDVALAADSLTEALTSGKSSVDMRLRYEAVDQDNTLKDASALTLLTRLGYSTADYKGFSATLGMEDIRIVGEDDYSVPLTDFNSGTYSPILDPEVTEVDQGFVKYASGTTAVKYGRQAITFDNERFIGAVGWRQDRQTYDALSLSFSPVDDLLVNYAYVTKRNRIFAEVKDIDAKDNLFNASYKTPIGNLSGYAYLLEQDNDTDNSHDTYGLRLVGSTGDDNKYLYTLEYATQESKDSGNENDADYALLEGGMVFSGMTAKVGYELLGSDSSNYGFSTPLATVHAFNGWSDQFLSTPDQGLADLYVSLGGKFGGGKWLAVYHDFSADDSTSTIDDLGDEINLLYAKKFHKIYTAGIKYASYSAGDAAAGKVDTDKMWIWGSMNF